MSKTHKHDVGFFLVRIICTASRRLIQIGDDYWNVYPSYVDVCETDFVK